MHHQIFEQSTSFLNQMNMAPVKDLARQPPYEAPLSIFQYSEQRSSPSWRQNEQQHFSVFEQSSSPSPASFIGSRPLPGNATALKSQPSTILSLLPNQHSS